MELFSRAALFTFLFLIACQSAFAQDESNEIQFFLADTAKASLLAEEAGTLLNNQQFEAARSKAEEAIEIYTQTMGDESREVADIKIILGQAHYYLGNFGGAMEIWLSALAFFTKDFDQYHRSASAVYNVLGVGSWQTGDYYQALDFHQRALELRLKYLEEESSDLFQSFGNLGTTYRLLGDYEKAVEYQEKGLTTLSRSFQKNAKETASFFAQGYSDIGVSYYLKGDIQKGIQYTEKGLELRLKNFGEKHRQIVQSYNNLGAMFYNKGDYSKALEYLKKALNVQTQLTGPDHPSLGPLFLNTGSFVEKTGNYEQALSYYEQAEQIYIAYYGKEHPDLATCLENMGNLNATLGNFDKAFEYLHESLTLRQNALGQDNPYVAYSYLNLGQAYFLKRDFEEALEYYSQALAIIQESYGEYDQALSPYYNNMALTLAKLGRYPKAAEYAEKGLKCLGYAENLTAGSNAPILDLLESLNFNGYFFLSWYVKSEIPDYLHQSRQFFHQAQTPLAQQFRSISASSKSELVAKAKDVYFGATATNYFLHQHTDSLHYIIECFNFAERSKALLLYEALQDSEALYFAGIPDHLLRQEYDLKIDIAYNDEKRQEALASGATDSDSTVLAIDSKLFDLNRTYENLIHQLETNYPQYYQAKYDLPAVSASYVQDSLLLPGQSLVEYLVGDSSVFIFLVQKDHYEVREVELDFPLAQWVSDLTTDGIYGYYTLPANRRTSGREVETIRNYTRSARQLYDKLLRPVENRLTEQVIIIPDGVLGYVPFEALLTKQPPREGTFESYPFVLNEHQISYCYSATLLREMRDKPRRQAADRDLLAMAPFFRGDTLKLKARIDSMELAIGLRDSLGPLPFSGEEVAAITDAWQGTPFYGPEASVEKFRELAPHYRIIHLSTHGKADDRQGDYAYLAFGTPDNPETFGKLYARDLYSFSLNADMVVLSACETGIGKLRKGEGIISVARAFAYAGAKSIFTTLWKVSDENTRELSVGFYRNLKAGMPKDEALRQAKLGYLTQNRGKGEATHPFFWAGLIGIGDMGKVE